ncbi:MAG TPA: class I tRNA ligase family protein, partial [bacterium]|nr:class I tRNA ligase family protein [bacterium]
SNSARAFRREAADYWMPVDQYIGGIEHATMHLIYARFFYKVLRDMGYVSGSEPFKNLLCQGMVVKDGFKMSKSKGNVVSVDFITERYGADTARLFILFAAPPVKDLEWSEEGVEGSHRFLNRVWRMVRGEYERLNRDPAAEAEVEYFLHTAIKKVTRDVSEEFQFNTAIASIMELVNAAEKYAPYCGSGFLREFFKTLLVLLYPFAPHLASELWEKSLGEGRIEQARWPELREEVLAKRKRTVVIQIDGKVRDKIEVSPDADEAEVKSLVSASVKTAKFLEGREIAKEIYIQGKIYSIVLK